GRGGRRLPGTGRKFGGGAGAQPPPRPPGADPPLRRRGVLRLCGLRTAMKRFIATVGLLALTLAASAAGKDEEVAKYIKDLKSSNAKTRATAATEIGKIGQVRAAYA